MTVKELIMKSERGTKIQFPSEILAFCDDKELNILDAIVRGYSVEEGAINITSIEKLFET